LLFVASDAFAQSLYGGSQVTDLGHHSRQAPRIVTALTVFFDDHPEVLISVEGRPADMGPLGDVGKTHRLSVTDQLGARTPHPRTTPRRARQRAPPGKSPVKSSHIIEEHIDLGVPREVAFNQWTRYRELSQYSKHESAETKREDGRVVRSTGHRQSRLLRPQSAHLSGTAEGAGSLVRIFWSAAVCALGRATQEQ
jgi:hypothetical protein